MIPSDFWHKSSVLVLGGGSWGTVLAELCSQNVQEVRLWMRDSELAREINSTRVNKKYVPELKLNSKVRAVSDFEGAFETSPELVIWALPSSVAREQARVWAKYFRGSEIVLHATKGLEQKTLKRMSEVLVEELPLRRIGVVSGPNLANEIARGLPAATVVASHFEEVIEAGKWVLGGPRFKVYDSPDVVGVEWAGTLKNILALASGAADALGLGGNARALLMARGLAETLRFAQSHGAKPNTFFGLAGVGDLWVTGSSQLSRNYRVGYRLGKGEKLQAILSDLGSVAEGVRTTEIVADCAESLGIEMPITQAVRFLLIGDRTPKEIVEWLMSRPAGSEF